MYKLTSFLLLSAQLLNRVWLFVTPWSVALQAPLSVEFSRQEYWSELLFPAPGGSTWPRDWTHTSCVFCTGRWILYHWATLLLIPWACPRHWLWCQLSRVRTAILLHLEWPFFALEGGITPTHSISQSGDQSNSSDTRHTTESALPCPLPHSRLLYTEHSSFQKNPDAALLAVDWEEQSVGSAYLTSPCYVGGSPVETWVSSDSPRGQRHQQQQSWEVALGTSPPRDRQQSHYRACRLQGWINLCFLRNFYWSIVTLPSCASFYL